MTPKGQKLMLGSFRAASKIFIGAKLMHAIVHKKKSNR
jgi:hypothetical protein